MYVKKKVCSLYPQISSTFQVAGFDIAELICSSEATYTLMMRRARTTAIVTKSSQFQNATPISLM